jgi:hypothetical protein
MSLLISYQDKTGYAIYANLFSATDKLKAFNPSSENFETISLATQSDFAIILSEDAVRKGYYSFEVSNTLNIPPTEGGDFYLIEVRRADGSSYDRESDKLTGTMAFYWDGEQEVDICGCQTESGTSLTAEDIWQHSNRTLTGQVDCGNTGGGSGDCPDVYVDYANVNCPDLPDIVVDCPDPYITINNNIEGLEELTQQLGETDAKVDEVIRLLNDIGNQPIITRGTPNFSNPIIGPPGSSSGGQSSIRVS